MSVNLFADDVKLYSRVDSLNFHILQSTIDAIVDWADKWQLRINISKSSVLHLGARNAGLCYKINDSDLCTDCNPRDLGIIMDRKLSYDYHIETIVRQAYSRVGILFKSFVSRDCDLLKRAYVTFIRPVLEYACSVWCPYKVKHITAIEKIQRSFTRRIPSLRDLSYEERLARINLEPLEIRRLKFDLVLHFKISKGLTPFDNNLVFTSGQSTRATRSHDQNLLIKPYCRTKGMENDFFARRINCWNSLPSNVRNARSILEFKKQISVIDFSKFVQIK